VFGCGGDRDRTKRPRMARVAEQMADRIVITSDNPRTEDPQAILDEVAAGLSPDGYRRTEIEIDRKKAIALAISRAGPGDVVLVAGKGHEKYQIVGDRRLHFDDVEVVAQLVRGQGAAQ
jgi:UDP-N-acetylmuramoyl-L-alanyl-D-glutamate--2,6-diaminopimelate ligase